MISKDNKRLMDLIKELIEKYGYDEVDSRCTDMLIHFYSPYGIVEKVSKLTRSTNDVSEDVMDKKNWDLAGELDDRDDTLWNETDPDYFLEESKDGITWK